MRTTANVVSHMNVEQGERPIDLGMERESTLVGIGVDLTLNGRTLRRLSHFLSLFLFPVFYQTFPRCQPLLSGEGYQSLEVRKRQGEILTNILFVNVRLCRTFPIIGSTNILNNCTTLIGNLPNFLLNNLGKAIGETVDIRNFFHFHSLFSFSLLLLISTLYRAHLEFAREI